MAAVPDRTQAMARFDRILITAFVPALALLAAGLLSMLAFWSLVDGQLPAAMRFIARWLPLLLIFAGLGWGLAATVRLWRRDRSPRP